jgi:hypothetical protein
MKKMRVLWVIVLASLVAMPMAGCASKGKVRLSVQKMCESAGGTYANRTCSPNASNQRAAKQLCESNGGVYDPDADACEYEGM